jgi:hypothetical protein
MRRYFNWLLGPACEHDYFIQKKYYDSYVDDSGYRYKVVVYKRYILKCRECGRKKDTSDPWQANEKPKAQRDAELNERLKLQVEARKRVEAKIQAKKGKS